ncbi:hypothetical protein GOP47_0013610 [Adiantum capillus-veneris]|uniref:Uncharacterized protein n=1 Tax=Adiantum capillus-veneris TaxID=13818 RepID=A0A9D4UNU9_ADICA|nr:hypothetical protein GOP47_0013610 [Adiantum capillus-veneris]
MCQESNVSPPSTLKSRWKMEIYEGGVPPTFLVGLEEEGSLLSNCKKPFDVQPSSPLCPSFHGAFFAAQTFLDAKVYGNGYQRSSQGS